MLTTVAQIMFISDPNWQEGRCGVCLTSFREDSEVLSHNGHFKACKKCIEAWLKIKPICPFCNQTDPLAGQRMAQGRVQREDARARYHQTVIRIFAVGVAGALVGITARAVRRYLDTGEIVLSDYGQLFGGLFWGCVFLGPAIWRVPEHLQQD